MLPVMRRELVALMTLSAREAVKRAAQDELWTQARGAPTPNPNPAGKTLRQNPPGAWGQGADLTPPGAWGQGADLTPPGATPPLTG